MNLHITHPAVRKVIERCEKEVRELTGNPAVSIAFIDDYFTLDFERIAKVVCLVTKVPFDEIKSPSRKKEITQARHLIAFFAKRFTKMTFREIGEQIGDRDHTTVMASISRVNNLIDSNDEEVCDIINKISRRIRHLIDQQ